MNTKSPILRYFESNLPDYRFKLEHRPNLIFRRELENGVYEFLVIQRDGQSNALAPSVAVTYNPNWLGEPASPLGMNRGFAQLRLNQKMINVLEYWYFYEPNLEALTETLERIYTDFQKFALPFLDLSRNQLLSDKLLQTALQAVEDFPPSSRTGLSESLDSIRGNLSRCEHPAYLAIRERIRKEWKEVPKELRECTNRLAYDVLKYL